MSRKGLRPHLWKYPEKQAHEQHIAWLRAKAQANFRKEIWLLSFDEFQRLWQGRWDQRGRSITDFCMIRSDIDGAWEYSNVEIITRQEHFSRQKEHKQRRKQCRLES